MNNSAIEEWKEGQAEKEATVQSTACRVGPRGTVLGKRGTETKLCVLFSALPREFYDSDVSLYFACFIALVSQLTPTLRK